MSIREDRTTEAVSRPIRAAARPALILWVPKIPSTSCDQAIFVDRAADERPSSDAVLPYFDLFG